MKITLKATILKTASRWEQILDFFKQDSRFEVTPMTPDPGEVVDVEDDYDMVEPLAAKGRLIFGLYVFKGAEAGIVLEQPIDPRGVLKTQLSMSIHELIDQVNEGKLEKLPELADMLVGYAELPTERYQYDEASS